MIIDKLKRAVSSKDWNLVCEAINDLDGSNVSPPSSEDEEFLAKLAALKNEYLAKNYKVQPETKNEVKKEEQEKPKRENLFESMIDTLDIEKEEGYDLIKEKKPSNRPKRRAYEPSSVECTSCRKKFEVNPMFAKPDYVCDRCVGRKYAQ